jgi:hypothetical protein
MTNNFPISVQNQPIVNLKHPERNIRGVLSVSSGYMTFDTSGYNAMNVIISSPNGNPKITIEGSGDGIFWSAIQPVSLSSVPSNLSAAAGASGFINTNGVGFYQVAKPAKFIRISQGSISNNSYTTVNVILYNGVVTPKQQDLQVPNNNSWYYTATSGGIVNTSPVLLVSSQVGSFLNALLTLNLSNAGATDTEVLIRSNSTLGGGSPTVVFRTFLKAGTSQNINFTPALRTTINQLFEVVLSATATVYVNAQGVIVNG